MRVATMLQPHLFSLQACFSGPQRNPREPALTSAWLDRGADTASGAREPATLGCRPAGSFQKGRLPLSSLRQGREIGVRSPRPDFSWRRLVGN